MVLAAYLVERWGGRQRFETQSGWRCAHPEGRHEKDGKIISSNPGFFVKFPLSVFFLCYNMAYQNGSDIDMWLRYVMIVHKPGSYCSFKNIKGGLSDDGWEAWGH